MEITKNTPLSEILNNQDVADELSEIEGSLLRTINERMEAVSAQIRAGGLGQGMLVNGAPLFYNEAAQISSDYLILSSSISMLVSDIKNAACDKELEELRKLRNLLLRDNDSWQALKEQYQREYNEKLQNIHSQSQKNEAEQLYQEYYGANGKITRVQKHIDENNEKIAEIDRRISTIDGGSSSGGSSSGGGSHSSSGGGTHGGGGSETPDSSDSPSSNSGGSHTSSGGGTFSGGGSEIPDSSDSPSSNSGGTSSSGGSFSGGSSEIPNEAPTEAPGEPATEAPSSNGGGSSSGSGSHTSSGGGTFGGGGSEIPNDNNSSDDDEKSSNRSNQDGRFDDPDPNKYKL